MRKKVPIRLQGILWSKDVRNLDLEKDKVYIIHQILMYGDFSDIRYLFHTYSLKVIQSVFISSPKKIYTKPIFALLKKFILDLEKEELDEKKYVRTLF
jgi:hypothetical protein